MIDRILSSLNTRSFAVLCCFFVVGIADSKFGVLLATGGLSRSSLFLGVLLNVIAVGYVVWLSLGPALAVRSRGKALALAFGALALGLVLGIGQELV